MLDRLGPPARRLSGFTGVVAGLKIMNSAATNTPIALPYGLKLDAPGSLAVLYGAFGAVVIVEAFPALLGRSGPITLAGRWMAAACRRVWKPSPPANAGMPAARNPHFMNRTAELNDLQRRLAEQTPRINLVGPSAAGKSQLALEYLHRQCTAGAYGDGVFWLRGTRPGVLRRDLAALAWRLRPTARFTRRRSPRLRAVARWLRDHPDWLLVVDDVHVRAVPALLGLIGGLPGHVLVVSRRPVSDWAVLELGAMPPEATKKALEPYMEPGDETASDVAVGILHGWPLLLRQLINFLERTRSPLADAVRLLSTRLAAFMREARYSTEYPLTATDNCVESFRRLKRENPAAGTLLELCSQLAPADIPLGILRDGAGALPEELGRAVHDQLLLERAIAALWAEGLAARGGQNLRVYDLARETVASLLGGPQRRKWRRVAIRLLRAVFPTDVTDPGSWPLCASLVPHVNAALAEEDRTLEPGASAWLLDRVGGYLREQGDDLGLARASLERAMAIRMDMRRRDDLGLASSWNNLALLAWREDKVDEARSHQERAVAVYERVLGPDDADTATAVDNLASMFLAQNLFSNARPLFQRALDIRERVYGPEHRLTATSLHNLGNLLMAEGQLVESEAALRRALAIFETTLGPDHPHTRECARSLDSLFEQTGQGQT